MSAPMITASIAASNTFHTHRSPPVNLPIIGALLVFADWLFFGRAIGISVAVCVATLTAAVLITNPIMANPREIAIGTGVLLAALLPTIEAPGAFPMIFAAAGLAYFALAAATP